MPATLRRLLCGSSCRSFGLFSFGVLATLAGTTACWGANFGTVVPIHGAVSDIALDERHGRLYAANLSAYRVEVVSTANRQLLAPIAVPLPPSAVAVSPDNRFLVVGEYQQVTSVTTATGISTTTVPDTGGLTVLDIDANISYQINLVNPVLTVTFGADGKALVVTRALANAANQASLLPSIFLFDPITQSMQSIASISIPSQDVASPVATFPAQIIQAAAGVSGDGQNIWVMTAAADDKTGVSHDSLLFHYNVLTHAINGTRYITTPTLGPRSISVNQEGANLLVGWTLLHFIGEIPYSAAQFPAANGAFNLGSHAWDRSRNLIFAQIPGGGDTAVLDILDTDNLAVRERVQLAEGLAGKSLQSSDYSVMYSASASGVMILPIAQLVQTAQVGTLQEDLLFTADSCNKLVVTQTLDVVSIGIAPANFTLSLPAGTVGVTLSATTGVTPAKVQIKIDPTMFQTVKGTTVINLTITSTNAVNLAQPVRLLINTRDFNQRGQILNIPGKLVDMLADPLRSRLYLIRQDKNLVLIYDMATLKQTGSLRTGNTPTQMAMTPDRKYLVVGNDNSQIANVFDLDSLQAQDPLIFPFGHYPNVIGIANGDMFALARAVGSPPPGMTNTPPAVMDHIDFINRIVDTPGTLNGGSNPSVFTNNLSTPEGAIAVSPGNDYLFLALSDGLVAQYDSTAKAWVATRKDITSIVNGGYASFSNNSFLVGNTLLNGALVSVGTAFPTTDGTPSGAALLAGTGIRTTMTAANGPGTIQRIDLTNYNEYNPTLMAEAPVTQTILQTTQVGQIGQRILPFTRSLAVSPDQSTIYAATISGLTILPSNFDVQTPLPFITSVVNAADSTTAVAPGGAIVILGSGLASNTVFADGYPLPFRLGDVCATVNDVQIPFFRVSSTLIASQLPFTTAAGSANLVVKSSGDISAPFPFNVLSAAPAVFHTDAGDQGSLPLVVRDDNYQLVTFTNPIHPKQNISIYLTGLGTTTPLPGLGQAAPSDSLAMVNTPPTVTLGSNPMAVTFAGMAPGVAGVYIIQATVPGIVQPGQSVPITIKQGTSSTTLQVRVVTP